MTTIATPNKMRLRSLIIAFVGIPLLALLGFFWLEIPDSHVWQLAFSLVTGLAIAAAFLWIVSSVLRSVRLPIAPCAHWLGASLLAVWMLIKWSLITVVAHIDDHAMERAGFWNSKLSAHMRTTFTFDRLIAWQHDLVLLLVWVVIPALLTPFVIETVARGLGGRVWRVAVRVLTHWQHWLTIILCDAAVYWLTSKLTGWRPSHSVHGELVGLAFRLSVCYVADFALVVLLIAVDSRLLAREYARRYTTAQPPTNIS